MVMVQGMTKLVSNDVIDALLRRTDQVSVEGKQAAARQASTTLVSGSVPLAFQANAIATTKTIQICIYTISNYLT